MAAQRIEQPVRIEAAGTPTKIISEFVGRVASSTDAVSIAIMESPTGWSEPGQTPEFDEYTVVLDGSLTVETRNGSLEVASGQAVHLPAGEWVRYSTPAPSGARYVSVCMPAFAPETVHRD
jgi:mannose-6-phosphate isomerase-like protein (cupin superfamily)